MKLTVTWAKGGQQIDSSFHTSFHTIGSLGLRAPFCTERVGVCIYCRFVSIGAEQDSTRSARTTVLDCTTGAGEFAAPLVETSPVASLV